jgi:hypothetical protein
MNVGLTKRQLQSRGWTQSQIRQFFSEPSQRGPYGQPLYAIGQVEWVEAAPEFQAALAAKRERANSASRVSAVVEGQGAGVRGRNPGADPRLGVAHRAGLPPLQLPQGSAKTRCHAPF